MRFLKHFQTGKQPRPCQPKTEAKQNKQKETQHPAVQLGLNIEIKRTSTSRFHLKIRCSIPAFLYFPQNFFIYTALATYHKA